MTSVDDSVAKVQVEICDFARETYAITEAPWIREFTLKLESGRDIALGDLYQYRSYDDLLEGTPNPGLNRRYIREALTHAAHWRNTANTARHGALPVLIAPEMITYQIENNNSESLPLISEAMPAITTFATFHSDAISQEPGYCGSTALFVWFQGDWGLPPPSIQMKLIKIEWNTIAKDWKW